MSIPLYGNEEKGLAGSLDSLLFTLCITQTDFPPYLSLTVWHKISFHIKAKLDFNETIFPDKNSSTEKKWLYIKWKNILFFTSVTLVVEVSEDIWVLGSILLHFSIVLNNEQEVYMRISTRKVPKTPQLSSGTSALSYYSWIATSCKYSNVLNTILTIQFLVKLAVME